MAKASCMGEREESESETKSLRNERWAEFKCSIYWGSVGSKHHKNSLHNKQDTDTIVVARRVEAISKQPSFNSTRTLAGNSDGGGIHYERVAFIIRWREEGYTSIKLEGPQATFFPKWWSQLSASKRH